MKNLVFIWIMLSGFSTFAQNTKLHYDNYINAKTALVNSDSKTAEKAISTFYEAIKSDDNFAQKAQLQKATEKLTKAGNDLEKQRATFNEVSTIMWKLVKDSDKVSQSYYQYCPMKKAYWLSNEKDIKNPYYGSSMLTCGKIAETKK